MKKLFIFLFTVAHMFLFGQESENDQFPQSLQFNFGRSMHGTGDIAGYQYGITYDNNFSKRLYYFVSFEGSLNDRKQREFIYENPDGSFTNSTLNDVTGGFQVVGGIGLNFVSTTHHDFGVGIGALGRYQSTSINYTQTILFPALTEFPIPVRIIENDEEQRTLALGGVFKINYYYKFANKWKFGFTGALQMDLNGDTIPYLTLGIGRLFY